MKGIAIVFDSDFEDGWRTDMSPILFATWDGTKGEVFTDLDISEKGIGCPVWSINHGVWETDTEMFIGHNLHGSFEGHCFDLMKEIKIASADYLQNEGKRFPLHDLARWNKSRSIPVELVSKLRKTMALRKGQSIKVARWALEDARVCFDLYQRVKKEKRVRFLDTRTGKKPFVDVLWGNGGEEE
jgi:hypothetical protein